jgi:hypothetical protein
MDQPHGPFSFGEAVTVVVGVGAGVAPSAWVVVAACPRAKLKAPAAAATTRAMRIFRDLAEAFVDMAVPTL